VERERHTLASLVDDFDRHRGDIAVVEPFGFRQRRTSYERLASLSRRFAAELERREIRKGERVVIWGANGAAWMAGFFGCVLRGVLAVPLDFAGSPDFISRVAEDTSPRLAIGNQSKLHSLFPATSSIYFEDFEDVLPHHELGGLETLAADDPFQIIFTSGTTGEPKGIVHTHKNVLASLQPIEREMQRYLKYERLVHPVRILHTLPLSHVFGQFMGLWIPPLLAAEMHYESRLVPAELVERIRSDKISVLAGVPRALDLMRDYMRERFPTIENRIRAGRGGNAWLRWWNFRDVHKKFGLKFWAFVCGGAALSPSGEHFWNSLGFVVVQGYGMTETTALVSLNHPFHAAPGTIGKVLPGREVRLSEEGEVLVRGQTISDATWQQGRVQTRGTEWLATGDLAEMDNQGNLHFKGRKKEVIVTASGMNIYPEDLEAALVQQPDVKAAAVIETESESGPEPLAVLVLTHDEDGQGAVNEANRQLAEYQQIRRWLAWPEADLPRTSTGKPLKREIVSRIAAGEIAQTQAQNDLPLDSLARVQLQAELEQRYGVSLDDAALEQATTRSEAEELIKEKARSATPRSSAPEHKYPKWPWHPVQQRVRSMFLDTVAMPVVRFLGAPRVVSNITEWPEEPALIVANHITSYDAPLVLYALPRRIRRRVAIAMGGELLLDFRLGRNQGNRFLDLLGPGAAFLITALFNVFPLPQFSGFRRSFRHAGEAIDHGYSVLVFPEGRRSDDGAPQPFKSGAGLLWRELGVPVIAVHLAGLGELKARRERWFRSGKIIVTVKAVLRFDPSASSEELAGRLREAVFGPLSPAIKR
jgi:long-chain acyl-CoA synthetase